MRRVLAIRRRARRGVIAAGATLGLLACSTPPQSQEKEFGVDASVNYWRAEPKGDVKITKGGAPGSGTDADLKRDLQFGNEYTFDFELDARLGPHRFGVEYLPIDFSGKGKVGQTFVFDGTTFNQRDTINSEMKLPTWRMRYDYPLFQQGTSDEVRGGLGGYLWTFDGSVDDKTTDQSADRKFTHFYPALFGSGKFTLGKGVFFEADAGLGALAVDRKMVDLNGALAWQIAQSARMSLGYRWMRYDFNETTNDGDFTVTGFYLGVTLSF